LFMSLGKLGQHKKRRLPLLSMLSASFILGALVLLALQLVSFAQTRDRLPTDITVAGVPVTGLTLTEAAAVWQKVYEQPIAISYQGHPIQLLPSEIGFLVNSAQMQEEIRSRLAIGSNYWLDFWNYLWQRPANPISVTLSASFSEAKLRDFLLDVAARYDLRASAAGFDLNTMTFASGANGTRMDQKKSLEAVLEALQRPTNRQVSLAMAGEGGRTANMETLKTAILAYAEQRGFDMDGPATLGSVVVIDLQNGEEMHIQPRIAYSAMSTIKIPILINAFSQMSFSPNTDQRWLMAASILCSNNSASNFLMQIFGQGANLRTQLGDGLKRVNDTVSELGAEYTFVTAPLYVGDETYKFSINNDPGPVPDPNFDAKPDTWSRTTALDQATLLALLYDCAEYGSGLMAAAPDRFNQTECKQMLELMSGNILNRLLELGLPPKTRIAHKNGWGGTISLGANVSDAGIVYSPGGNYIIAIYMWEQKASPDGIGSLLPWEVMEGVSQIVYNYFNPTQPLTAKRIPDNPFGAIDCVMPVNGDAVDLENINNNRFNEDGAIVPQACYGWPVCVNDQAPPSLRGGG
jgi:beta-lactamase class A